MNALEVIEAPPAERSALDSILQESFEGWYLRHARKIIHEVETVRVAVIAGTPVGLVMLKSLGAGMGYVYYVAVAKEFRKKGVGTFLLDDSLRIFKEGGVSEVFASVEVDNTPSEKLFASRGFTRTSFGEVSSKHGPIHALNMYRMMVVVPGEVLLRKSL